MEGRSGRQRVVSQFNRYQPLALVVVTALLIALVPHREDDSGDRTSTGAGGQVVSAAGLAGANDAGPSAAAASVPVSSPTGGGAAAAGAAPAGGRRTAAAVPSAPVGAGVGTPDALNSPRCDRTTGRIKVPFKYAPSCVRPWTKGANNGGTTSQGVTADAITIVVVAGGVADQTDDRSVVERMWRDLAAIYAHNYETWGREVKIIFKDFGKGSSPDEVQQRAMAAEVAALKPFLVLAGGGGPIFSADLAAQKIVSINGGVPFAQMIDLAPYVWATTDVAPGETAIAMAAEYIAKRLQGKPARWAGDAATQAKARVFGLVHYDVAEPKWYAPYYAQHRVTLADDISYNPDPASFAEKARTIVARLKDKGVTTVVTGTDLISNIVLTKEATNQLYFPEWLLIGTGGTDIVLVARLFDQQQWSHAFGYGPIAMATASPFGWRSTLLDWFYGPGKPDWRAQGGPNFFAPQGWVAMAFLGIHLAGPTLNPTTFRDGMFALPASGGAACGCITNVQWSFGRQGGMPGFDDYSSTDDVAEKWWDADSVAPDETTGATAPGFYRYMNGGRRLTFGQWPAGEPRAFDEAGTTEPSQVKALPPNDATPSYPCEGCPSSKPS